MVTMVQPLLKSINLPIKKSVYFYFDILSPHAWIAFELLGRHKDDWGVDLRLRPISQSELRRHTRISEADSGADFVHLCRDAENLGKHYNIPLRTPQNAQNKILYKGSQSAMRLLTAVNQAQPTLTQDFSRTLWNRVWNTDEDITQRKSLIAVGTELGQTVAAMEDLLVKTKEKSNTIALRGVMDEALRKGASDAPTLVVDGVNTSHLINGSHQIHALAQIIGNDHTK